MRTFELDDGWTFWRGAEASGPGEKVRVPHDAMLVEGRSRHAATGSGGAWFHGGCYRYERTLAIDPGWLGGAILLEFEGVYRNATVSVNGDVVARHRYGYTGFYVDVSDHVHAGDNALVVTADNSEVPNSRWYSGSGIYRPVWLHVGAAGAIAPVGVRVTTTSVAPAVVRIETSAGEGDVRVCVLDGERVLARGEGRDVRLELGDVEPWSAEHPRLYTAHAELVRDGSVVDTRDVRFGVRTVEAAPSGLLVNGVPTKLQGGCVHHDNGILGAADVREASFRKVALLKRWGFNAIRSAHNPLSKSMLDACDELGMYVIDEFADTWYLHKSAYDYASNFEACHVADLREMVEKDLNHPSVIMYSIGNENSEPKDERGLRMARSLVDGVHALDPTRPVTAGVNLAILGLAKMGVGVWNEDDASATGASKATGSTLYNLVAAQAGSAMERFSQLPFVTHAAKPYLDLLDVAGYNYGKRNYARDLRHEENRLIVGTETLPYDLARTWPLVEREPRLVGDFMWTAVDYLGEVSLASWTAEALPVSKPFPWLCADTGALDLVGNPTGEAAMAATVWGASEGAGVGPLVFVRPATMPHPHRGAWRGTNSVPCWAWRGCEGVRTTVEVYTRAPLVALWMNGRHLTTHPVRDCHADFVVPWQPGTIEAVALAGDGTELGRSSLVSAGADLRLAIRREDARPLAAGDVTFADVTVEDGCGVVEGNADRLVRVTVEGGELLGFGSACVATVRSYLDGSFPTRMGRALAVVRVLEPGACALHATAPGLPGATLAL